MIGAGKLGKTGRNLGTTARPTDSDGGDSHWSDRAEETQLEWKGASESGRSECDRSEYDRSEYGSERGHQTEYYESEDGSLSGHRVEYYERVASSGDDRVEVQPKPERSGKAKRRAKYRAGKKARDRAKRSEFWNTLPLRVEEHKKDERFEKYGYDKVHEAEELLMRHMADCNREKDTIWKFLDNLEKAEKRRGLTESR